MKKFGLFIAKNRILILIISIILLIPAAYNMAMTDINYDLLSYLPKNLDTMKGQTILDKNFSNAANAMLIVHNMESKDVVKIKDKVSDIEGVDKVIWVNDLMDTSIPKQILPDDIKKTFYSKNSTMLMIKFNDSASASSTQEAIGKIRKVTNKQCFLSGMSAIVKDTKDLADKETPLYVLLAVILSAIVLSLTNESIFIPFIFLIGIGMAILYNLGTNRFLGNISYVTKSIAAVLQLGVTMDYSIFLMHRYNEEKEKESNKINAMAEAISKTMSSITGSSLTTIAGFLALCTMQLTLGKDIGIVMAKGCFLGVVSTVTILPSLILIFDKLIVRFNHKAILPAFNRTSNFVSNHYKVITLIFVLLFIPALYGQANVKTYYTLDESLPKDLPSIVATNKLKNEYNMTTTHFIIVNKNIPAFKLKDMTDKIEKLDGINNIISYDKFVSPEIPESFVPDEIKENFIKGDYKLILVNSKYKAAREEENFQIGEINKILKEYDKDAMVTGEGPLTKDLIKIADKDFKSSNSTSILVIFGIITLLFISFAIPILLVLSIELAIVINMAIPFYTGATIPFVASIVIGCIQLGATVDYAILLTTRYKEEIRVCKDKYMAMEKAVKGSAKSIVTSALSFFAATAGVGIISNMEMIKTLCIMMARGALISMGVIIFILPSLLLISEKFISKTTRSWRVQSKLKEKIKSKFVGERG